MGYSPTDQFREKNFDRFSFTFHLVASFGPSPINQLWTETSSAALQQLEEAINSMRGGIATIRSWCDRMSGKLDEVEGKLAQNKKRKSIWLQEDSPNTEQVVDLTETSGEDVLAMLKSAKGKDKAHQRER